MPPRLAVRLALLVPLAALAACSSSGSGSPSGNGGGSGKASGGTSSAQASHGGNSIDVSKPCSVLTPADIQIAFGGTVSNGTVPRPNIRPECDWSVKTANLGTDGDVVLFYPSVQSSSAFNATKNGLPGLTDISGIGDGAFYEGSLYALTVLIGEKQITVQAVFGVGSSVKPDPAKAQADLTALAKIAAAKF